MLLDGKRKFACGDRFPTSFRSSAVGEQNPLESLTNKMQANKINQKVARYFML